MYGRIHEDVSTRLTPPSRKRTVFRGALKEQGLLVVHTHHEKQVGRRIDESSPIVDARLPD